MAAASIVSQPNMIEVVIPAGATGLSGEVDLGGNTLMAIMVPSTWVTATSITFQGATRSEDDGGTYADLYDDSGAEVTITVAASRMVGIDANALKLAGVRWIKIRSGTTASPVNQTGAPTLRLSVKG